MTYQYAEPILQMLLAHGLRPRPTTPPSLVRDYLSDLYRYELRALRQGLLRKDFPKTSYAPRVEALRSRYPLLSLPLPLWTLGATVGRGDRRG